MLFSISCILDSIKYDNCYSTYTYRLAPYTYSKARAKRHIIRNDFFIPRYNSLLVILYRYFKIFFFFLNFLAAVDLRCCKRAFSSCSEQRLLFIAVRRLLIVVASRCGARALGAGFSSCGTWAQ